MYATTWSCRCSSTTSRHAWCLISRRTRPDVGRRISTGRPCEVCVITDFLSTRESFSRRKTYRFGFPHPLLCVHGGKFILDSQHQYCRGYSSRSAMFRSAGSPFLTPRWCEWKMTRAENSLEQIAWSTCSSLSHLFVKVELVHDVQLIIDKTTKTVESSILLDCVYIPRSRENLQALSHRRPKPCFLGVQRR